MPLPSAALFGTRCVDRSSGEKPEGDFRLGTEHEKDRLLSGLEFTGAYDGERGIRALLDRHAAGNRGAAILDRDNIIGLFDEAGAGAISLEPGGQFVAFGRAAQDAARDRRPRPRPTSRRQSASAASSGCASSPSA